MDFKRPPSPERDRIPTYEESIAQRPQPVQSLSSPDRSTLSTQIAASRTARIDALIVDALLPRLHAQVDAGLTRTTTVLFPTDSTAVTASSPDQIGSNLNNAAVDVVIAADATVQDLLDTDVNLTLLRLRGSTHTAAFWSQPGAGTALEGALRARLRAEGHRIAGDPEHSPLMPRPQDASPPNTEEKKKGFWRRAIDSASDKTDKGVGVLHRSAAPEKVLGVGEVKVDVEVRDVAVRVCSELGLYESRTGTAIVVRVEIGGSEWGGAIGGETIKN